MQFLLPDERVLPEGSREYLMCSAMDQNGIIYMPWEAYLPGLSVEVLREGCEHGVMAPDGVTMLLRSDFLKAQNPGQTSNIEVCEKRTREEMASNKTNN